MAVGLTTKCRGCGQVIYEAEQGSDPSFHANCGPNRWAEPEGPKPFDLDMKRDITEVIWHSWRGDTRSQQVVPGPSELGDPCRRKLAYRLAGASAVNMNLDPWPALVGTGIHRYLETAVNRFQEEAGVVRWLTEVEVYPDDLVIGHCDLFDLETGSVWDVKSMNSTKLKDFRETSKAPDGYRTQIHLYGRGMERAGYEVGSVGLIAVPRSGWLYDMFVWSEPYDPSIAENALKRMYEIANEVMDLEADKYPQRLNQVEPTPSRLCSFCDFYWPDAESRGIGCPGK